MAGLCRNLAAARYSPLAQIDRINAKDLHIAWRWKSPDTAIKQANPMVGPSFANELTPLMVGGLLYTSTSLNRHDDYAGGRSPAPDDLFG